MLRSLGDFRSSGVLQIRTPIHQDRQACQTIQTENPENIEAMDRQVIPDSTHLEDDVLATIGRCVVNLVARGHSVEIVPCFASMQDRTPKGYSVSVPTLAFIGVVPLDELTELLAMAVESSLSDAEFGH